MGLKKNLKETDGWRLRQYIDSLPRSEYRNERRRLAEALQVREPLVMKWMTATNSRTRFTPSERAVITETIGRNIF